MFIKSLPIATIDIRDIEFIYYKPQVTSTIPANWVTLHKTVGTECNLFTLHLTDENTV